MTPDIDGIIERLRGCGYEVTEDFGPGPTSIMIRVNARTHVLMACDFNREDGGWEAVVLVDDDQTPLLDGPLADAPVADIADWILTAEPA